MTVSPSSVRVGGLQTWILRATAAYLTLVAAATLVLWGWGDDGWLPTLLLFGPRWAMAVPLAGLLPAALYSRSRGAIAASAAALALVAGPFAGLTVSLGPLLDGGADAGQVRILTLNTDGRQLDQTGFARLVAAVTPDVVFLQECSRERVAAVFPPGWHVDAVANTGLVFASRFPFEKPDVFEGPVVGPARGLARYTLDTPAGPVVAVNVHLPTPRRGFEATIHHAPGAMDQVRADSEFRGAASRAARAWVGRPADRLVAAGDFNLPPESVFFRRDWGDLSDAFSAAGTGWGHTMMTRRFFGVRIDHVLYAPPWRCQKVWVGPDVGSAHRPVIADLFLGPNS